MRRLSVANHLCTTLALKTASGLAINQMWLDGQKKILSKPNCTLFLFSKMLTILLRSVSSTNLMRTFLIIKIRLTFKEGRHSKMNLLSALILEARWVSTPVAYVSFPSGVEIIFIGRMGVLITGSQTCNILGAHQSWKACPSPPHALHNPEFLQILFFLPRDPDISVSIREHEDSPQGKPRLDRERSHVAIMTRFWVFGLPSHDRSTRKATAV